MKSMKIVRMLCVLALMMVGFAGSAGAAAADECGSRLTCETEETVRTIVAEAVQQPSPGGCVAGIECDVIVDGATVAARVYGQACVPGTTNCVSPNAGVGQTGAGATDHNNAQLGSSAPLIEEGIICIAGICTPGVSAPSVRGGGTTQTVWFNGGSSTAGVEDSCVDASGCGSSGAAPVQTGIVLTR